MATATATHYSMYTLRGFATNFSTPTNVSIGTTEGGDDIMAEIEIPAGNKTTEFPEPKTNLSGAVTYYYNGIEDTDTWTVVQSSNI